MKLRDREKHTLIKFVLALGSSLLGVMLLSTIMVIAAPATKPAADTPWGNNVQVNDDATAESAQMAVAVAASKTTSDVYAVWQDPRNGDNDIYFSHSNDAGQTWGAGLRIHHDTGDASQNIPDIALSTGGTLHVAWEDQREDGFNNIYYANSTDNGVTWSTEIRVNDVPTVGQYVPSIAVMTDTVCIAWSDSRNGYQRDIYADCSTDGGVSWGTDTRVSDDGGSSVHAQPDIAIATSGRVHVAWHDYRDGNYNIYYSHSTVGGWSTNARLNLDTGTANQSNAEIAVNGNTVDVIWVDQRDGIGNAHIYSIRSTTGGDSWQTYNQQVSSLTGAATPELTTDGSGTPWATWRVYTDMEYILYSDSYGPNGWDTVNETITGSTMTKLEPAIAGGNTDVYVAWYGGPYENQDIWLSTRENTVWGDPVQVNDEGDARQHYPTIATGGTDNLYAAWVDYREAQYNDGPVYFAQSEDKGATWGYDVRVSDDQHDTSQAPVLGVSKVMTVHAVWESTVYDFQHIYYDRSVDGGVTWRDDKQIDGGGMGYTNATDPDMVISGTETLYVVWVQYPGLYLNYSKDEGTTWITPSQILTSTWQIGKPALGIDTLGTLHLAWEETQADAYRIGYAQSKDGGETWTAALYIRETPTATQKSNVDMVVTPDQSHIHIVWQEGPSGEESVYYSASTNGGLNWNTPTTLNRIIPATDPAIARDSSDILYATWLQDDGNHGDIYYTSSIDDGDNWPLPGRVNDDTTNWPQQYPAIAGGNSAYAIWQDFREINWDIYAAALEFEPVCPVPLEGISLEGPQATMVGTPETFAAKISPADATQPVIYTWTPKPAEGQWKPEAVYYWRKPGNYEIQVVVENCGGIYTDTMRVVVSKPKPKLPCIEGKVYYANTPLAGVKVELIAGTSASAAPEQTTTTTRNGSYQFCDVEPGTYMLKRYAPSEEYIGWVASRIKIKSSNLIKNLDLPKKMTLSSPADEALIFTTVPTLTWQPLPEAGRYTLQINKTADWALVEQRSGIATPEYQLSEKLASGQSYTWQVDAYTGTHWIGTTQNAFEFTTAQILTVTLPPIASIYTSLRIEDAPANVTVNKLIGDNTGKTHLNYVDIVAYVWTWTSDVRTNVNVVLNVPDNRLGAPVNTWIRNSNGGALTSVPYTSLGSGRYQVNTNLTQLLPLSMFPYRKQVVWRFRIPNGISPQTLNLSSYATRPGYLIFSSASNAELRLTRMPSALIIANRSLLYDNYSSYEVSNLLAKLYDTAQGYPHNDNPLGVIYYVDRYSTQAANWDNTSVNYTSSATANAAAEDIDDLIEDWVEDGSWTLSYHLIFSTTVNIPLRPYYLLMVGDDDVIPYYRYNDPSNDEGVNMYDCNGNGVRDHPGWCTDSNTNPSIRATDEDYFFTDNPYADLWGGTDWQTGGLELAVGRLVGETAADMHTLLNSSLATDGSTGRAVMASVAGWELGMSESPACPSNEIGDIINVANRLAARGFNVLNDTETPHTVDVMSPYDSNWNNGFRSAANGGMDIFFIGGHNHYSFAGIPGDDFSPDDTCSAASCRYNRFDNDHPLAFIVGCHGGLTVPDVGVAGGVDDDMVYDLVHEGARAYVGATGFSYGSPGSLCYNTFGERLLQHFFDEFLPSGSQSRSIGGALSNAKDAYVFGYGSNDGLDRKTVTEFNLYGVPWQRLDYPGGSRQAEATETCSSGYSALSTDPGPIIRADTFRYTRTITVDVANYETSQVITGGITYDLLSIPGGEMALAPELPILPYLKGYTMTLPISATIEGTTLVSSTCADIGSYEIPILIAAPWTEGGMSYTTTTSIDTFYPPSDQWVRWQQQQDRALFTLYPIQHNPTSNDTQFCSQMVFEVVYDAPLALAVSQLQPVEEVTTPGETISVTGYLENIGDELLMVTATLTLLDDQANPIGWTDAGPFSIPSGGREPFEIGWSGELEDGHYGLQLLLWNAGQLVGMGTTQVDVVGGEIIEVEVPQTTITVGDRVTFRVSFRNYFPETITATFKLEIQDNEGWAIATLDDQTLQIEGDGTGTANFAWDVSNVPAGTYTAQATVRREDGPSYGPRSATFDIAEKPGYDIYLPLIVKDS